MLFRTTFALAVLAVFPLNAADLEPSLGKKGKLLLEESFASAEVIKD